MNLTGMLEYFTEVHTHSLRNRNVGKFLNRMKAYYRYSKNEWEFIDYSESEKFEEKEKRLVFKEYTL